MGPGQREPLCSCPGTRRLPIFSPPRFDRYSILYAWASYLLDVSGLRYQGLHVFLGISEWLIGALLLAGFWNKKLGLLGALGSVFTFLCTVTIIPFMPDGWAVSAGGFPQWSGALRF